MIFMIERRMVGVGGHVATQHLSLSHMSGGQEIKIITTRDFLGAKETPDIWAKSDVLQLLISYPGITNSRLPNPKQIKLDAASLTKFFSERAVKPDDIIIIPSANYYEILMILEFYRTGEVKMQTRLRFVTPYAFKNIKSEDLTYMRELIEQKKLFIHTEIFNLSQWLNNNFQLNSKPDFLLPCTLLPDIAVETFRTGIQTKSNNFTIGYLGGLRSEKGKFLIPDIVKELRRKLAKEPSDINIKFVMQNHRHKKIFSSKRYYNLWMALKLLPTIFASKGVKIVRTKGNLSQTEFLDILGSVDIIILPYDHNIYKYRGSGIIYDGVLALKPFIHTSGIGANEFLEFGNAEQADKPSDFAEKIIKVIKGIDNYRHETTAARSYMIQQMKQTRKLLGAQPETN